MINLSALSGIQKNTMGLPETGRVSEHTPSSDFFDILQTQMRPDEANAMGAALKENYNKNDLTDHDKSRINSENNRVPSHNEKVSEEKVDNKVDNKDKTASQSREQEGEKVSDREKDLKSEKPISGEKTEKNRNSEKQQKTKGPGNQAQEIDFNNLSDGLNRFMDVINKTDQKHDDKNSDFSARDLKRLFDQLPKNDRETAGQIMQKLKALLENVNAKGMHQKDSAGLTAILAKLKELIHKNAKNDEKSKTVGTEGNKNSDSQLKSLFARIESLAQKLDEKGNYSARRDDAGTGNLNLNSGKFDFTSRRADAAHQGQQRSTLFRENLQNIVNNARVFVKDGNNGTISLKLYPRELGSVNINLGLEQGVVHGKFLVDTAEARTMLLDNLEIIKSQLRDAGITVGSFQVDVSDQREAFQSSKDRDALPVLTGIGTGDEINSEYEVNSGPAHNGLVNLVI